VTQIEFLKRRASPLGSLGPLLARRDGGSLEIAVELPDSLKKFGVTRLPQPSAVEVGTQLANRGQKLADSHLRDVFRQRPQGTE
jgi:hypothetical protein